MSENVASAGLMAPLVNPVSRDDRDEISETLYDETSGELQLNYEGTIVFTDEGGSEYGLSFGVNAGYSTKPFEKLKELGLEVDLTKAKSYSCVWYNGSDSDMSMLTLEEFLDRTNQ